ncbi:MAG: class I SAM-dependent methyltransferase, partial [Pseudomonadota bacterium]
MMYETMKGQAGLPRWCETVFGVMQRIEVGSMGFTLPDGRSFVAKGSKPGPDGHFKIHNDKLFGRIVRDGDMGFAEAYMDGWWDSDDLEALLDVALSNNEEVAKGFPGRWVIRAYDRLRHWLRANTKAGSRKNISYHYDLGNDFYSLWLDDSMTYSSALYSGQGETLGQAQQNKYASICDRMGLKRDDHVLEIGCGWGGFAEYAIRERGARVTGLTLSKEQHDFAKKR